MIKAILFDLDGTLLDRETSLLKFITDQYHRFANTLINIEPDHYCNRFIALDARGMVWKDVVYQQLVSELHITTLSWQYLLQDYIDHFRQHCVTYPNVHAVLDTLKTQGYALGVITNGRYPFQLHAIQSLSLTTYFSGILISEKEGIKKPDPAIFHKATEQLKIKNEEAIYIGDHPQTDIEAAKKAGLKTIWKQNPHWENCPHADASFETYSDLEQIIKTLG